MLNAWEEGDKAMLDDIVVTVTDTDGDRVLVKYPDATIGWVRVEKLGELEDDA